MGRRRSAAAVKLKPDWFTSLGKEEQAVVAALARRRASSGVSTIASDCNLAPARVGVVLERLCTLGLVTVEEKNTRPTLGISYDIERASIDSRATEALYQALGRRSASELRNEAIEVLRELEALLQGDFSTHPLVEAWLERIRGHRTIIEAGEHPRLEDDAGTIAQYPGGKYLTLMRACAGIAVAVARGEVVTLRDLSDQLCGHSKALDQHRGDLGRAMGCPLDELGVLYDLPELFVQMPVECTVAGRGLWLDAGVPYVVITGGTAEGLEVRSVEVDSILAVENKAAFRHLVEVSGLPRGVGCLWLHGQRGLERRLLARVASHRPVPVFVWTDIDVWGIYIQEAVGRALGGWVPVIPVRMQASDVHGAHSPQLLTDNHRTLLERFGSSSKWYPLVRTMLLTRTWVEQEEMLRDLRTPGDVAHLLRSQARTSEPHHQRNTGGQSTDLYDQHRLES